MNESADKEIRGEDFWREHVMRAQEFPGSNLAYCRQHGLTKSTFNSYKKMLGFSKASETPKKAFVKVEPPNILELGTTESVKQSKLPDAKWVAELILKLMAGQ